MTDDQAGQVRSRFDRADLSAPIAGAITLALSIGLLWLAWILVRPLALLLAAIILACAVDPVVGLLTRRMPRSAAIAALYGGLLVILALVAWMLLPPLVQQSTQVVDAVPWLVDRAQAGLARWGVTLPTPSVQALSAWITGAGSWVVSLPVSLVSSLLQIVVVLGMSAYWLVVAPALRELAIALAPADRECLTRSVIQDAGSTMGGYVRATVINAAIVGALVYAGLVLIGLEYPLALGAVAAVGELIPYLGPSLAAVPAIVIALLDSPSQALLVLGFYVGLQLLENQVLVPLIMRQQTRVPPVLVIFAIAAGGTVGGVLGALVAVPLAGALLVVSRLILVPAIRRHTRGA